MTPGTIGVLSLENARYTLFHVSHSRAKRPEGTIYRWAASNNLIDDPNPDGTYTIRSMGESIITASNALVQETEGDWLWILGDDHTFGEDALMDLLAHDVDIVCPVNIMRKPPFHPLIFDDSGRRWTWDDLSGKEGLIEVDACGNAGMLVKRHVFENMYEPWYEWGPPDAPFQGSDLYFCYKARQAGYKVLVDTNTVFGHMALATFVPGRDGDHNFGALMQVQGENVAWFRFAKEHGIALVEQGGESWQT